MKKAKQSGFDYEETVMGISDRFPKLDYRAYHLFRFLPKNKKLKVLDFGCGAGWWLRYLYNDFPYLDLYGCDISKNAIHYAKKVCPKKIRLFTYDGITLPFSDNFFDCIICLDVIEHIPNYEHIFNELNRVVRKGGYVHFCIPCEGNILTLPWVYQKTGFGSTLTFHYYGHVHPEFTTDYIEKKLRDHGLTPVYTRMSEFFLGQLLRLLLYFLPKEMLRIILGERKAKLYSDIGVTLAVKTRKETNTLIMAFRQFWLQLGLLYRIIFYLETRFLGRLRLGGATAHITCKAI